MKTIFCRTSLAALLTASSIVCAQNVSSPRARPQYTVIDLGPLGGPPGQPFVIKNNGLISGAAAVSATVWHAVLWYKGSQFDIGTSGLNSAGFGNNEQGQVVGQTETPALDPNGEDFCGFATRRVCLPFVWQNGATLTLPTLASYEGVSRNGTANAINNRGEIAGVSENTIRDTTCPPYDPSQRQYQRFQFKPVIWKHGAVRQLPTYANDPDGIPFAINDYGQAVGGSGTCTNFQANGDLTYLYSLHAVLWENGSVVDLGNLGGTIPGGGNAALNINNRGEVVGASGTADGSFRGFLWTTATGIQDLGTVQDDIASVALGINDGGDIVGISFDANFNGRAFIRSQGGVPTDLNSLVAGGAPLFLFDACSINARGDIIGIAFNSAGEARGFLAMRN